MLWIRIWAGLCWAVLLVLIGLTRGSEVSGKVVHRLDRLEGPWLG